ncbi:MAG: hypothetical protein PWQ96_1999 [Clostridia bacterium]|nr:hypothetical protein [Clostridia bacterium]
MKKSVIAYIFSLLPFAIFFLFKAILTLKPDDWFILLILTVMFIILEIMAIRLPSGPVITLTSGLSMVALFCFGMSEAILSAFISLLIVSLLKRWEYYRTIYNISMYIISIYFAGNIFYALNGVAGVMEILVPWPYIGAIIIYFILNSILTAGLFSLIQKNNVLIIWYRMMSESFKVYIAEQILAFASAFMFINQGFIGIFLLIIFLVMLQMVFRSHYQLFERERERAVELEAILNNVESGILMIDSLNTVKLVNKRFGEIFNIQQELKDITVNNLFQLLHDKLINKENFLELLKKSKTAQNIEVLSKENKKKVVKGFAAPVLEENEEIGRIVTLTDITAEWEKNQQLQELYESAIRSLAAAVDARDTYTSGHSSRVSDFSVAIGKKIKLPDNEIEVLRFAALLHDIGKIGIDDKILRKQGPLNNFERAKMMEHPIKGVAILEEVHAFKELIPIIKYHHERFDGNGYLEGRKDEDIPLGARILAVADAFDAMTSNRSYRAALTVEEALRRLQSGKGSQFDPVLVDVFVSMVKKGEITLKKNTLEGTNEFHFNEINLENETEKSRRILPRHGKVISILYQISLESRYILQLDVYLQRLLEILHDSLSPNLYCFYLRDPENRCLKLKASAGLTREIKLPVEIYMEDDKVQEILKLNKPKLSKNKDDHLLSYCSKMENTITEIIVPITNKENLVGLLVVKVFNNYSFREDELYLLMTVANQVGQNIEIAQYHQEVVHASKYDYLTNVYNYGQFIKILKEEIEKSKILGHPISLCITDLDNFKDLNDRYGHLIGDEALKQFATHLKNNSRDTDIVARYGGDEFAIIFPNTHYSSALEITTCLLNGLNGKKVTCKAGSFTMPTTSFGIATYPSDCEDVEGLIQLADGRKYQYKRSTSIADTKIF